MLKLVTAQVSHPDLHTDTGSMASLNPRNTGVYTEMAEKSSKFYSQDMQITFDISLRIYLERDKATAKWTKYPKAKRKK